MFTRKQILEIQEKLASLGIKDTDFELMPASQITGDESVAIVSNNKNKRLLFSALSDYLWENIKKHFVIETVEVNGEALEVVDKTVNVVAVQPAEAGMPLKVWYGSQEQYDALTPSDDTIYFIKEETE